MWRSIHHQKERWQHPLPKLSHCWDILTLRSKIPTLIRVQTNPFRVVCLQHESQPLHKRYLLPQRGEPLPTIDECNRYYYKKITVQLSFSEKSFSIQIVMVVIIRDQNAEYDDNDPSTEVELVRAPAWGTKVLRVLGSNPAAVYWLLGLSATGVLRPA